MIYDLRVVDGPYSRVDDLRRAARRDRLARTLRRARKARRALPD